MVYFEFHKKMSFGHVANFNDLNFANTETSIDKSP